MTTTQDVINTLLTIRQTGQTTTCVGVLYQHKDARMIVPNMNAKLSLIKEHPTLDRNRFIVVDDNIAHNLRGLNCPLIFDTTAIAQVLQRALDE